MFSKVGVYEIQQSASLAFSKFGTAHKTMADEGMKFIVNVGPVSGHTVGKLSSELGLSLKGVL